MRRLPFILSLLSLFIAAPQVFAGNTMTSIDSSSYDEPETTSQSTYGKGADTDVPLEHICKPRSYTAQCIGPGPERPDSSLHQGCYFEIPQGCRLVVESIVGSAVMELDDRLTVRVTGNYSSGNAAESTRDGWSLSVPTSLHHSSWSSDFYGWMQRTWLTIEGNEYQPGRLHIRNEYDDEVSQVHTTVAGRLVPAL